MYKFFEKLGKLVVRLVIICLILIISFQMLLNNEKAAEGINRIEQIVGIFFNDQQQAVPVSGNRIEGESGRIIIDLMQDLSLPEVWLLKNGEKVDNFTAGIVEVEVYEGDLVSIDAGNYQQPLWFEVRVLTPAITTWGEKEIFRTSGNILGLGIVRFASSL